jgi:hypothetical protein
MSASEHKYLKASAIPTINDSHIKLRKLDYSSYIIEGSHLNKYEEGGEDEVVVNNRDTRYLELESDESEDEPSKDHIDEGSNHVLSKPKLISDSRHVKDLNKHDSRKYLNQNLRQSRSISSLGNSQIVGDQIQKSKDFVKNEIIRINQQRPHKSKHISIIYRETFIC